MDFLGHHLLNFCKNNLTHKNFTLSAISADALVRYLEKLTELDEKQITKNLPEKFPLIGNVASRQILFIIFFFWPFMLRKNN